MTPTAAVHTLLKTRKSLARNTSAHPLDVLKIKSSLSALGHYDAPEWGVSQFPDSGLFQAIKAFQKTQGLKTDGVMKPDGETLAALQEKLHGRTKTTAVQTTALALQDLGRNGDTVLAHLTQDEAQLLHDITDGGSINPQTGLLEFWTSRFGGSKYSRAQREKAANRQDSAARASSKNQQSGDWDAGLGRTLGYNDFNPGGAYGGNNLNGTKKTGNELARHNRKVAEQEADKKAKLERLKAEQLAKMQQLETDRREKSQRDAAEQDRQRDRVRSFFSAPQDGDIQTGMIETNAPSAQTKSLGFNPSVDGPFARVTLSTFAPSTQPNQNGYMASSPASGRLPDKLPGSIPGMTGFATPAQQTSNVDAFQTYTANLAAKKAKEEAKAREAEQKSRQKAQEQARKVTEKRAAAKPSGQGSAWQDSVQQQTGYTLTAAGGERYITNPDGRLSKGLEWGYDLVTKDIPAAVAEVKDRLTNPDRSHGLDPNQTNITAGQAFGGPAAVVGLGVIGEGASMLPGAYGKAGGLLSGPAKIASDRVKKNYLNTPFNQLNKKK